MRRIGVIILAGLLMTACSTWSPRTDPAAIAVEPPIGEVLAEPLSRTRLPRPLPPIAIVLSSSLPAYADVAEELTRRFQRYDIYDLGSSSEPPVTVLRIVNDSNPGAVVAIGPRAARSSVAMSKKPVVFSQVFNYRAHNLLTGNSRGIAVLPPLDAQLAAWKKLDPTIAHLGIIIGEGHDELITEARLAAQKNGIALRIRVTQSDQETLYFFRRMIRDIDGFWLFPDNRVLSARVLQQMLDDANRQQIPVNVPSESMLSYGAMISMSSLASDIADIIVEVVREIQAGNLARIPPITQLTEIRVRTNDTVQVVGR